MKRFFIYLSLLIMCLIGYSSNVYADDAVDDAFGESTMDEQGRVTEGGIIDDNTTCGGMGVYYLLPNDPSGLYITTDGNNNYWIYACDGSSFYCDGYFIIPPSTQQNGWGREITSGYQLFSSTLFLSAIPIFNKDDTEAIANYCESGDKSGASNSSNWREDFSTDVPLPHNLKILKGVNQLASSGEAVTGYPSCFNYDVVVSWEQADVIDNLKYEMEVCFYYMKFDSDSGKVGMKEYSTAYYPLRTATDYSGSNSITETLTKSQLNKLYDLGADKLLSKMAVRLRNKCGNQTSNYVSITIDFKKQTASADESAYTDDSDVQGEYDDTDINADTTVNGGVSGDVSLSGVMSFIRDGFGLLGNGGIIALLSSTFLYLPNSIWIMLKFLVAMMIAVCIIKLVKDVVT